MGKTKPTSPEIDAFIAGTPAPARNMLIKMREAIRSTLPAEAQEVISYRMPAFKLNKVLVWYAAFRDHCSLFPTAAVVEQFRDDLTRFKTAKGTIQFPLDKPLPLPLIKKLTLARLQQSGYKPAKRST
jgi:uncharacterized protein YdhG (YjbR/CyaY superfamily)